MLPWAQIGLASRLTWCPVGWLAGGCGARAALSIERLPTFSYYGMPIDLYIDLSPKKPEEVESVNKSVDEIILSPFSTTLLLYCINIWCRFHPEFVLHFTLFRSRTRKSSDPTEITHSLSLCTADLPLPNSPKCTLAPKLFKRQLPLSLVRLSNASPLVRLCSSSPLERPLPLCLSLSLVRLCSAAPKKDFAAHIHIHTEFAVQLNL